MCVFFFFFKQKTAYEMRISDWSSDVCSSDLTDEQTVFPALTGWIGLMLTQKTMQYHAGFSSFLIWDDTADCRVVSSSSNLSSASSASASSSSRTDRKSVV